MKHELIYQLLAAKAQEETAKANRIKAENALSDAVQNNNLEGSKTVQKGNYKVTVTNKISRKLDFGKYQDIRERIPEQAQFVDFKPAINLKKLRHLEATMPELVAECITSSPAKTAVKIEEIKNG